MSDEAALERAIRRFPYRLKRWHDLGGVTPDVLVIVHDIEREYRRIVKKEMPNGRDPPDHTPRRTG